MQNRPIEAITLADQNEPERAKACDIITLPFVAFLPIHQFYSWLKSKPGHLALPMADELVLG